MQSIVTRHVGQMWRKLRRSNEAEIVLVFSLLISISIFGTLLSYTYRFTMGEITEEHNTLIFGVTVVICIVGQIIVLWFIRQKYTLDAYRRKVFKAVLIMIWIIHAVLNVLLVTIAYETIMTSHFQPWIVNLIIWISYLEASFLMGFLSYKFCRWLRVSKSYLVFFYALAFASLAANLLLSLLYIENQISIFSSDVQRNTGGYVQTNTDALLTSGYQISTILAYVFLWIATIVLLRNYSNRIGKVKYWLVLTLPLLYFALQFQPYLLELLTEYRILQPILFGITYTLFFSISKVVGAILFGIGFLIIGLKISNATLRNFMIMSGFGLILFFISNQIILLANMPFPPFAIVSTLLVGLSSYLVFVGIYYSAIYVAQDISLRVLIRKSVDDQTLFLDKIATSEMEDSIQTRVLDLTKRFSSLAEKESGIVEDSEVGIKEYLNEVLKEIKEEKR